VEAFGGGAVWRLGRAVVLAVLVCIIILAVIGLGFYGLKSKTGWLRIQVGIWRFVTFSIEIGRQADPAPREGARSRAGQAQGT
jgi:hypothetical protein